MTFEELGLCQPIQRAINGEGYTIPTPIQSQAIPHIVAGRDLLGCAQTGTGKTAAFALPILHRLIHGAGSREAHHPRIRVLVLSPTRELACQIGESFHAYGRFTGLRHTVVFGGVPQRPQTDMLRRGIDILIATPGRLVDLMNQGFVDLRSVETFVLDEADRMLDMGFLPDMRRVLAKLPSSRQTLLFSATIPDPIEELANTILRNPVRIRIAPVKETTALIEQSVCFVPRQQKPKLLAKFLTTRAIARAIVFTRTKHGADRVTRHLAKAGVRAEAIHGDKSQAQRQRTFANFKANRTSILVATDIAARGIDVDGISHIVNYDLPHEPETYIHRIGRTGRAGATGFAVSFCDDEERQQLKAIERLIRQKLLVERISPEVRSSVAGESPDRSPASVARPDNLRESYARRPATGRKSSGGRPRFGTQRRPGKKLRRFYAAR